MSSALRSFYSYLLICVLFPFVASTNVTQLFLCPATAGSEYYVGNGQLESTNGKWTVHISEVLLKVGETTFASDDDKPALFDETFLIAIRPKGDVNLSLMTDNCLNPMTWMHAIVDKSRQIQTTPSLSVPIIIGEEAVLAWREYKEYNITTERECLVLVNQLNHSIFFMHESVDIFFFFDNQLKNIGHEADSQFVKELTITINKGTSYHQIVISMDYEAYNFQISNNHQDGEAIDEDWEMCRYNEFVTNGNILQRNLPIIPIWIASPKIEKRNMEYIIGRGVIARITNAKIWEVVMTHKLQSTDNEVCATSADVAFLKDFVEFIYVKIPKINEPFKNSGINGSKARTEWRRLQIQSVKFESNTIVTRCTLGEIHAISNLKTHYTAFQPKILELSVLLPNTIEIAKASEEIAKDRWYLWNVYKPTQSWTRVAFADMVIQNPVENLFDFVLVTFEFHKIVSEGPTVHIKFRLDNKDQTAFGMLNYDKANGQGKLWIEKLVVGKKMVVATEANQSTFMYSTDWKVCSRDPNDYEDLGNKKPSFWQKNIPPSDMIVWSHIRGLNSPFINDTTKQLCVGYDFGEKGTLRCKYGGSVVNIEVFEDSYAKQITFTHENVQMFAIVMFEVKSIASLTMELHRGNPKRIAIRQNILPITSIDANVEIQLGTENAFKFPIHQFVYA